MYICFSILLSVPALATVAAAAPNAPAPEARQVASLCPIGVPQCCENTLSQAELAQLESELGITLQPSGSGSLFWSNCSPLSVVGTVPGTTCFQPLCCNDNSLVNGYMSDCSPIIIA